jgi:hypothetical protein
VIAYDEATKTTGTAVEMVTGVLSLIQGADLRVPVLLVLGQQDGLNCGLAATNWTSSATVMKSERPWLGSHLPCLNAYVLPGGGARRQSHAQRPAVVHGEPAVAGRGDGGTPGGVRLTPGVPPRDGSSGPSRARSTSAAGSPSRPCYRSARR